MTYPHRYKLDVWGKWRCLGCGDVHSVAVGADWFAADKAGEATEHGKHCPGPMLAHIAELSSLQASIIKAKAEAIAYERSATVTYLRGPCESPTHDVRSCDVCSIREALAAEIERGEYRK